MGKGEQPGLDDGRVVFCQVLGESCLFLLVGVEVWYAVGVDGCRVEIVACSFF